MKAITISFAFLAAFTLAACKDVPGADGRYAVYDGGNRHGSP
jgi:hypothetical protein